MISRDPLLSLFASKEEIELLQGELSDYEMFLANYQENRENFKRELDALLAQADRNARIDEVSRWCMLAYKPRLRKIRDALRDRHKQLRTDAGGGMG